MAVSSARIHSNLCTAIVELEKPRRLARSNENIPRSEHPCVLIETRRVSSRSTPRVTALGSHSMDWTPGVRASSVTAFCRTVSHDGVRIRGRVGHDAS